MRAGDLKWNGPREGLVKCLLSRNRWYFAFCLTIPPEIVISSVRTQICVRSISQRSSQHFRLSWMADCFTATGIVQTSAPSPALRPIARATHDFLSGQQLLGNDRREPAQHVVFAIDDDDLRDACSIAVPRKQEDWFEAAVSAIGDGIVSTRRSIRVMTCTIRTRFRFPRFQDWQSRPFASFGSSHLSSALSRSPPFRSLVLSPRRFFRFDPTSLPCVSRPPSHRFPRHVRQLSRTFSIAIHVAVRRTSSLMARPRFSRGCAATPSEPPEELLHGSWSMGDIVPDRGGRRGGVLDRGRSRSTSSSNGDGRWRPGSRGRLLRNGGEMAHTRRGNRWWEGQEGRNPTSQPCRTQEERRVGIRLHVERRTSEVHKKKRGTETHESSRKRTSGGGAESDDGAHVDDPVPQPWTCGRTRRLEMLQVIWEKIIRRNTQGTIGVREHAGFVLPNTAMISIRMLTKNRTEDVRSAGPCSAFPVLKSTPPT